MDQHLQIMRRNQEIIHSQRDEPLHELLDVPVFPPVLAPYGLLTPAELAALALGLLMCLRMKMMRRRPPPMTSSQLRFYAS
jgi:hypothetical protein